MPERPTRGACDREAGTTCRLSWHGWHQRKTGPKFALRVMRCRTHEVFFTLYPPGYAPYQRRPVAEVGTDGHPLLDPAGTLEPHQHSLFAAALDASSGVPWDRSSAGSSDRWWSTQRRHIARAMTLCGVAPQQSAVVRERVAAVLGVPGLLLTEQSDGTRAHGAGYVVQGQAVVAVLTQLARHRPRDRALLEAGYVSGVWGAPFWWDAEVDVLRAVPAYRPTDTRAPPGSGVDRKEPTTSVR